MPLMRLFRFVPLVLVACLLPGSATAGLIAFQGLAPGDLEHVLFNQAGLVDSGLTVTGNTDVSGLGVSFVENSTALATPSAGQARVAGQNGVAFDWVTFFPNDPLFRFYQFEANVNVTSATRLRITALGSSPTVLDFTGGNGQNRFGFAASGDDYLSAIVIQSLDGDLIQDVRQVRIGTIAPMRETTEQLIANPEPGTLIMFGTGLFGLAYALRRGITG